MKPPVIRWPGGCFADDYHWQDGIGPRDQRPRRINIHWGEVIETNQVGPQEFIASAAWSVQNRLLRQRRFWRHAAS
jgi:alpha-L-arabinofuranosidase